MNTVPAKQSSQENITSLLFPSISFLPGIPPLLSHHQPQPSSFTGSSRPRGVSFIIYLLFNYYKTVLVAVEEWVAEYHHDHPSYYFTDDKESIQHTRCGDLYIYISSHSGSLPHVALSMFSTKVSKIVIGW